MAAHLPDKAKIAKEAKECVQECVWAFVWEFILFLVSLPFPGRRSFADCMTLV